MKSTPWRYVLSVCVCVCVSVHSIHVKYYLTSNIYSLNLCTFWEWFLPPRKLAQFVGKSVVHPFFLCLSRPCDFHFTAKWTSQDFTAKWTSQLNGPQDDIFFWHQTTYFFSINNELLSVRLLLVDCTWQSHISAPLPTLHAQWIVE